MIKVSVDCKVLVCELSFMRNANHFISPGIFFVQNAARHGDETLGGEAESGDVWHRDETITNASDLLRRQHVTISSRDDDIVDLLCVGKVLVDGLPALSSGLLGLLGDAVGVGTNCV